MTYDTEMKQIMTDRMALLEGMLEIRGGFNKETAEEVALRVLNYFGYHDEIIDNALNQEDRRLFYYLQDLDLLQTRWEETQLASGRNWRIFYWGINVERLREFGNHIEDEVKDQELYVSLPETVWAKVEEHTFNA